MSKTPNDPREVVHAPPQSPILRSRGSTPSEQYLAELAEKTFLNLWSHSNPIKDDRQNGKGHGRELCDLLVWPAPIGWSCLNLSA
jgi:hypothetical protein